MNNADPMLKPLVFLMVGSTLLAGGCSKGAPRSKGPEASLPELTRALQTWVMAKGSYPTEVSQLTNFPTLQGKSLPTPPPGQKLVIVLAKREVVFADQ